jgi:hypothetical protein
MILETKGDESLTASVRTARCDFRVLNQSRGTKACDRGNKKTPLTRKVREVGVRTPERPCQTYQPIDRLEANQAIFVRENARLNVPQRHVESRQFACETAPADTVLLPLIRLLVRRQ